MHDFEPLPALPRSPWTDRMLALLEVLLLSGILSSVLAMLALSPPDRPQRNILADAGSLTSFLVVEALITIGLIVIVQRLHGERLRDLGFRPRHWIGDLVAGIVLVPFLFGVAFLVAEGFRTLLPAYYIDHNPLLDIIRTPEDLRRFILAAILAGGFKEELQRAFILVRFQRHLGGAWVGLLLWSVAFGAGHYMQGPQGMVAAGLFGLLFGVLYLARKSLVAPIACHAVYDVLALLGYWYTMPAP